MLFILLKGFFDTANLIVQLGLCQDCEKIHVLLSDILNCEWYHHVLKKPEIFRKCEETPARVAELPRQILLSIQLTGIVSTFLPCINVFT